MKERDLADLLVPLNEATQQILLPCLFDMPVNTKLAYSAGKGVKVADSLHIDFGETRYYCLLYDNEGFEKAKRKILCQIFADVKPDFKELSPKLVREAEKKLGLGEICNVRFSKYKGPFSLEMCFGESEEDSLHVIADSETHEFQNYKLEKHFVLGKPKLDNWFVDVEPSYLNFAMPDQINGGFDLFSINHDGNITPRNFAVIDDKFMPRFEQNIGRHLKNMFAQVSNVARGFGENDYFHVAVHHEPRYISGKIYYYWSDDTKKLRSDLGSKDAKKNSTPDFISKLSKIESAVKASYAEVLKLPEDVAHT